MIDCPSGTTKDQTNDPHSCNIVRTNIAYYDLTYILNTIVNQFAPGELDARADVDAADLTPHFGTGFTATKPYKMRGRFGNGSNTAIYIPGLNLHHTFTVATWIYAQSTTGTLLSKDKGSYTGLDSENFLDLEISDGKLSAKLYNGSNHNFNGSCITDTTVVSPSVWVNIAYAFTFTGEGTEVNIYVNAESIFNFNVVEVYVEDKDQYTNAFLMASSGQSNGNAVPQNAFEGYMYRFGLWYSVEVSLIEDEVDNLGNCSNCSHVNPDPTHCPKNAGSDGTSQCLWDVAIDDWVGNDAEQDCLSECGDDGCVRDADCNLCDDRQCQTCINFDSQYDICTECITNASKATTNDPCTCNTSYWFSEGTDQCEECDSACTVCLSNYEKDCTECKGGFFKQENVNTCLNFCPSNFNEVDSSSCSNNGTSMFCLTFDQSVQWSSDFKHLLDSVNAVHVQLGQSDAYANDDPWLHRSLDNRFSVYFDGSDDLLEILEEDLTPGLGGLRMTHTMTIQVWAKRTALNSTSITLLSKIDESENGNDV